MAWQGKKQRLKTNAIPRNMHDDTYARAIIEDWYRAGYKNSIQTQQRYPSTRVNNEELLMPPASCKVGVSAHIPDTDLILTQNAQDVFKNARYTLMQQLSAELLARKRFAIEANRRVLEADIELKMELFVFTRDELKKYARELEDFIKEGMAQC